LDFTNKINKKIAKYSSSSNPNEVEKGRVRNLKRNSRAVINKWKDRLSDHEIEKVKKEVGSMWKNFYSKEEW
jgi:hypothetical protein